MRNTTGGYCRVDLCGPEETKRFLIHRLVATLFIENPDGKLQVDHIDGNKLNNHLSNLRWATRVENLANRKVFKSKKSGLPKGVRAQCGKYMARIRINGKNISLGTFETIELAATAYADFARKHYGTFAKV